MRNHEAGLPQRKPKFGKIKNQRHPASLLTSSAFFSRRAKHAGYTY